MRHVTLTLQAADVSAKRDWLEALICHYPNYNRGDLLRRRRTRVQPPGGGGGSGNGSGGCSNASGDRAAIAAPASGQLHRKPHHRRVLSEEVKVRPVASTRTSWASCCAHLCGTGDRSQERESSYTLMQ